MLFIVFGVWRNLGKKRKWQLIILLITMLASGISEIFSLAAVMPLLAAITNSDEQFQNVFLQNFANFLGFDDPTQIIFLSTFIFCIAAFVSAVVRIFNLWLSSRTAAAIGSDLSCEIYKRSLYQPYIEHLKRNTSEVISNSTSQIGTTIVVLNLILQVVTSSIIGLFLLVSLIILDWKITLNALTIFLIAYFSLAIISRRSLKRNSKVVAFSVKEQLKALQEGLGAIREVLLSSTQQIYMNIYKRADWPLREKLAQSIFLGAFPRYLLESLGLILISLLALFLTYQTKNSENILPKLGIFALASQRLLPILQQIYSGWAGIKASNQQVKLVIDALDQTDYSTPIIYDKYSWGFKKSIEFKNISFKYSNNSPLVLSGINFKIRKGERIGIAGTTGSGKSTLIDILIGLLPPTKGEILVDGVSIYKKPGLLKAWMKEIANVPQSVYLIDSSIAENIALGVPKSKIDMNRVKIASNNAQLSQFIENKSQGYRSFVGERGIKLSGGQRQRIGIARAYYKNAKIFVFDEATSALDNKTELGVMNSINSIRDDITVIIIAHRLSTLKFCDRVLFLEKGKISKIVTGNDL